MNRLILAAALALAGCAGKTPAASPAAEPIITTKPEPTIVEVKCKDHRDPPAVYPDTDEVIAMIMDGDIFRLSQVYRAGRDLRIARLATDDVQIKACAGE